MVSCDGLFVAPIVLANVGVPETVIVPSVVANPLIVPVMVLLAPEKVAVAVPVLSSKVMAVTVTVFAKLPSDASALTFQRQIHKPTQGLSQLMVPQEHSRPQVTTSHSQVQSIVMQLLQED